MTRQEDTRPIIKYATVRTVGRERATLSKQLPCFDKYDSTRPPPHRIRRIRSLVRRRKYQTKLCVCVCVGLTYFLSRIAGLFMIVSTAPHDYNQRLLQLPYHRIKRIHKYTHTQAQQKEIVRHRYVLLVGHRPLLEGHFSSSTNESLRVFFDLSVLKYHTTTLGFLLSVRFTSRVPNRSLGNQRYPG